MGILKCVRYIARYSFLMQNFSLQMVWQRQKERECDRETRIQANWDDLWLSSSEGDFLLQSPFPQIPLSLRTIPWSCSITAIETIPLSSENGVSGHSFSKHPSNPCEKSTVKNLPLSFLGTPTAAQRTTQAKNRAHRGLEDHIFTLRPLFLHTRTGFSPHYGRNDAERLLRRFLRPAHGREEDGGSSVSLRTFQEPRDSARFIYPAGLGVLLSRPTPPFSGIPGLPINQIGTHAPVLGPLPVLFLVFWCFDTWQQRECIVMGWNE